jgi:hypothetical protein
MKATTYIKREIKKEMVRSGKITKIDARKQHFVKVAMELGFENDKAAFEAMGVNFIKIAREGAPSIN